MSHRERAGGQRIAKHRRGRVVGCACLLAACLAGCEQGPTMVEGKVSLDGQPLDEALIMFVPLDAGRKKTGGSLHAGNYHVDASNGLFPGRYRVEIIDNPPMELAHRIAAGKAPEAIHRRRIPRIYSQNSPLTAEVVAGENPSFDFELKSSGP